MAVVDSNLPLSLSQAEHRRLRRRSRLRSTAVAWCFLGPVGVFFTIFLLVPVGWVIWQSFNTGGVVEPSTFVGLDNWRAIFKSPETTAALGHTLLYAVVGIPTVLILGLLLALFLQNIGRGSALVRAALYFPALAPVVIVGLVWLFVLHPDFGILNLLLRTVGAKSQDWLGSTKLARPSIIAVEVWRNAGFWALFFLAALVGLPRDLYQAAALDGSTALKRFWHLTLPLLRPALLFGVVFATIQSLQIFDSVYVLTDGANNTSSVVWYMYQSLFAYDQVGYGAALACLLLAVILLLTGVQMWALRSRRGS